MVLVGEQQHVVPVGVPADDDAGVKLIGAFPEGEPLVLVLGASPGQGAFGGQLAQVSLVLIIGEADRPAAGNPRNDAELQDAGAGDEALQIGRVVQAATALRPTPVGLGGLVNLLQAPVITVPHRLEALGGELVGGYAHLGGELGPKLGDALGLVGGVLPSLARRRRRRQQLVDLGDGIGEPAAYLAHLLLEAVLTGGLAIRLEVLRFGARHVQRQGGAEAVGRGVRVENGLHRFAVRGHGVIDRRLGRRQLLGGNARLALQLGQGLGRLPQHLAGGHSLPQRSGAVGIAPCQRFDGRIAAFQPGQLATPYIARFNLLDGVLEGLLGLTRTLGAHGHAYLDAVVLHRAQFQRGRALRVQTPFEHVNDLPDHVPAVALLEFDLEGENVPALQVQALANLLRPDRIQRQRHHQADEGEFPSKVLRLHDYLFNKR